MFFLFLEFLGTSELMLILVVALILFGPRKLPQISRQIGKGLAEFKKASEDFRQTWEKEVKSEFSMQDAEVSRAMLPPETPVAANTIGRGQLGESIQPGDSVAPVTNAEKVAYKPVTTAGEGSEHALPTRKRDWL